MRKKIYICELKADERVKKINLVENSLLLLKKTVNLCSKTTATGV